MKDEWYENRVWNPEIEREFFSRVGRAKRKRAYLIIQAFKILMKYPDVALRLFEEAIRLGEPAKDDCDTYCGIARARLALGQVEESIEMYLKALSLEEEQSTYVSMANLEYPLLVSSRAIYSRFVHAFDVSWLRRHVSLPIEAFELHCARAIILAAAEEAASARENALAALAASSALSADYIHTSGIDLICNDYPRVIRRLREIASGDS
jgi:tetratricopeptide (TPR) repeat protein